LTSIIKVRLAYKAEDFPLEQQPPWAQEDEVRRRRRRSRQATSNTRRHLLNGGLAVWAGVVTIALLFQLWPDGDVEKSRPAQLEQEARPHNDTAQAKTRAQGQASAAVPDPAPGNVSQTRTGVPPAAKRHPDSHDVLAPKSEASDRTGDRQDRTPIVLARPADPARDKPADLDERLQAPTEIEQAAVAADSSGDAEAVGADKEATSEPLSDIAPFESAPEAADQPASPHIARAQFTSGIEDREPVDRIDSISARDEPYATVFYFTDIVDMGGETVTHLWEHEGTTIAEVTFDIGSDRWRTWSSKQLMPNLTGEWRVVVIDAQGTVLKTDTFDFKGP
jgi:hypothetical protein